MTNVIPRFRDAMKRAKPSNSPIPGFQEKLRTRLSWTLVPQTDTGGPEENSKALERPLVKELGKLAL